MVTMTVVFALITVLGLAVGSFVNVVIHRVPLGLSLITPPSRCAGCGHRISWRHNVPVVSWLMLRGRCARCSARISIRYPSVELLTAVLFLAVSVRLADIGMLAAVPAYLYFTAVALALGAIDIRQHRLPAGIVNPSYVVLAVLLVFSAVAAREWSALARAAAGAAVLFAVYLAIMLVFRNGMGFGDVRFSGVLGAILGYLSWSALVVGAFAGFLFGAVVGVVCVAAGRDRRAPLPFGPFMIAGAFAGIFAGDAIATAYLAFVGA